MSPKYAKYAKTGLRQTALRYKMQRRQSLKMKSLVNENSETADKDVLLQRLANSAFSNPECFFSIYQVDNSIPVVWFNWY